MKLLYYLFCWSLVVSSIPTVLTAQADSVRLDGRFAFTDGIFGSLAAVQHNQPDYRWDDVNVQLTINPNTLLARLAPARPGPLPVDRVWGFSRDGVLFRRLQELPPEGEASLFAGVWEKGRICLYSFEREVTRMVEIKAYVPQTGRPFRSAKLPRTETETVIVMLDFQTGATAELDRNSLLEWIAADTALRDRILAMPPEEVDLVRVVQTFNDRNPVWLPKG